MKKALLSLIVVSATLLYAKATECPKLDTKITTNEQLEMAEAFLLGLDTFSNMKDIYLDVLKKYNNTSEPELFVNADDLKELSSTAIWGTLTALDVLDDHIHYEKVINSIDAKNSNWCDLSSYENQLKVEK